MTDWLKQLSKLEGAVVDEYCPFDSVIHSSSPSVDFTFGKGHGLPFGFGLLLYGPPKSGKSLLARAFAGQLHRDDPKAFVVYFNTELREVGRLSQEQADVFGIDRERYIAFDVNTPDLIFDRIEKELASLCQEGCPIKLIVIDSLTNIVGRRSMHSDGIMTQQIGDEALTLKEGYKRILPVIRKHKIATISTAHIRAEMDPAEIRRGNTTKVAAPYPVKHLIEYFMSVEDWRAKEGRQDLTGREFLNDEISDLADKNEQTGHKIKVCMKDSSMGVRGRTAIFTLDYKQGIINRHEEIFLLGINRNIITRPNNRTYTYRGDSWVGYENMLTAIKNSSELYNNILNDVRKMDE